MTTKTATKLGSFFTNDNPRKVWSLTDDRPQWLQDAVYAAHSNGADAPNDWIYSVCRDVCREIDDETLTADLADEDDSGRIHEWVDGQVDYTQALYQWQADMCLTDCYANAESSLNDLGMSKATGEQRVAALQYQAIEAITQTILSAANDNPNDDDDE